MRRDREASSLRGFPARLVVAAGLAVLLISLSVALAACGDGQAASGSASPSASADPVVAKVDGDPVYQSAVELAQAEDRFEGGDGDVDAALSEAIDRHLLADEAARLEVAADAVETRSRLEAVIEEVGGEEDFAADLAEADVSRRQVRDNLEIGVLRSAVAAAKFAGAEATTADARRFYRAHRDDVFTTEGSVKLGAIFVRNEGIASNAMKRLKAGRPFKEVARQFSIDPELKNNDGMMGWVSTDSLPGGLGKAVEKIAKGRIGEPVAGSGGVYIFKVLDRKPTVVRSFSSVREELVDELTAQRQSDRLDAWLKAARKAADVERL